jgi:Late competence development protein ComFB
MDSTTFRLNLAKTYLNAMEILVEEEVERRIQQLPEAHRAYLNRMEIIAYALNQLPSLYATGEKGLTYQLQLGRTQHAAKIQQAVQQSLSAVLRDPILNYEPLRLQASAGMRDVLKRIRTLLHNEQIDWETLPEILEALVRNTPRGDQIAAINSGLSLAAPPPVARRPAVGFADDFDQDETIGMVGIPTAGIPAGIPIASDEDKPWKRVRAKLGAKSGYMGGAPTAWDDAHLR